jgi:nitrile hydratase subunit beta
MVTRNQPSKHREFATGDTVTIDDRSALGHCRTPWYLRGKTGIITHIHGVFRDAEKLAYHKPGQPKRTLYKVRLNQHDIWPNYSGPKTDTLETDIYEHWLRPVEPAPRQMRKRSKVKS